jgi:hypothetical protein
MQSPAENPMEKTIVLSEVSNEDAAALMEKQPRVIPAENIREGVPRFTKVDDFTTFLAEYTLIDENLVIHFFGTQEHPVDQSPRGESYWQSLFPDCLNTVGQSYFQATAPRLTAKYTAELHSWFFKAQQYAHLLDLAGFVRGFLEALDRELEAGSTKASQQ